MGENAKDQEVFSLNELREMKAEITKDVDTRLQGFEKILDNGLSAIRDMLQGSILSNDKAHDELKADSKELRSSIKEVYLRMNREKDETDKKISAVRTSVEKRIIVLEKEPGKKASALVTKIGGYVLLSIVSMALFALIQAIANGAVPIP